MKSVLMAGALTSDPITFLDLFTTDSAYNFDKYSNKEYDELIHKVKQI